MKLNEKLKSIRKEHGLTIDQLIERINALGLNASKSMVSRWENGLAEPTNTYLSAYAKVFNIDMNYLLGIVNEPSKLYRYGNGNGNVLMVNESSGIYRSNRINGKFDGKLAVLFDAAKDLTDEEIESVISIINQIRRAKGYDDDL